MSVDLPSSTLPAARLGEVQGHDGDLLERDVLPHVELGPVGKGEGAYTLALVDAAVIQVPQFRALVFGVPLAVGVAEGVDPFLGARFFLFAPGAADGRIDSMLRDGLQQGARLEQVT